VKIDGNNVLIDGIKYFSLEEVGTSGNWKNYKILDVNNVPRMFTREGILYFYDDKMSYTINHYDGSAFDGQAKSLAKGIMRSDIFTPTGFNPEKKFEFIKINNGVLYKDSIPVSVEMRNKNEGIWTDHELVDDSYMYYLIQDGFIIGTIYQYGKASKKTRIYDVFNLYDVRIAELTAVEKTGYISNSTEVTITIKSVDGVSEPFEHVVGLTYGGEVYYYSFSKVGAFLEGKGLFDIKESKNNEKSTNSFPQQNNGMTENSNSGQNQVAANNQTLNSNSSASFTQYSTKTEIKLDALKKDAVAKSDFETAAAIKAEQDLRKSETELLAKKQKDLDEKVKAEDFAAASQLQKEIKPLKEKIEQKTKLRTEIEKAVAGQDFEKAESLKQELLRLY
jgi:hypothetical protein